VRERDCARSQLSRFNESCSEEFTLRNFPPFAFPSRRLLFSRDYSHTRGGEEEPRQAEENSIANDKARHALLAFFRSDKSRIVAAFQRRSAGDLARPRGGRECKESGPMADWDVVIIEMEGPGTTGVVELELASTLVNFCRRLYGKPRAVYAAE